MGTSELKIPVNSSNDGNYEKFPARACCVVVEYVAGGTLKKYLFNNRRKKLAYKIVVQLALDMARGWILCLMLCVQFSFHALSMF